MARVFLVRHATHALVGKALAGRMPGVDLSEHGHAQAGRLAAHFADMEIGRVLSSPLARATQTATPIAGRLGSEVEISETLNEIDCGAWTGMSFSALAEDPRWQAWNRERGRLSVPDGESAAQVAARILELLDVLAAADGKPTILVTHSDVIKMAVLGLLKASLDLHDRLEIDPASITTIDLWRDGGKIVSSNQTVAV